MGAARARSKPIAAHGRSCGRQGNPTREHCDPTSLQGGRRFRTWCNKFSIRPRIHRSLRWALRDTSGRERATAGKEEEEEGEGGRRSRRRGGRRSCNGSHPPDPSADEYGRQTATRTHAPCCRRASPQHVASCACEVRAARGRSLKAASAAMATPMEIIHAQRGALKICCLTALLDSAPFLQPFSSIRMPRVTPRGIFLWQLRRGVRAHGRTKIAPRAAALRDPGG